MTNQNTSASVAPPGNVKNVTAEAGTYFTILTGYIAILLTLIAFGEKALKMGRWIRNRITRHHDAVEVTKLIVQWFELVDANDNDTPGPERQKRERLEDEICFRFGSFNLQEKAMIKASRRFRKRFLGFVGRSKRAMTLSAFLKYAHLDKEDATMSLQILSSGKKKYTFIKFPLHWCWSLIQGRFNRYATQQRNEDESTQTVIFADFEMPVKLIRLYYKV